MAAPIFWTDLAARFRAIPDWDPRNPLDAEWRADGWGEGLGKWVLLGGTESERDLFKTVARMGAVALGHPGGEDAYAFWLDRLRRDSIDFHGRGGAAGSNADRTTVDPETGPPDPETGSIRHVCEASARNCLRCEAEAFEAEQRLKEADLRPTTPQTIETHDFAETAPSTGDRTDRRARVNAFVLKCRQETPVKVLKKHLWLAVGHKTSRQFHYWQAGVDRPTGSKSTRGATQGDDRNFQRILARKPAAFVELLQKMNIV